MSVIDIVLDTNVLYSGLYSSEGASYAVLAAIGKGQFKVHISVPLLFEYEDVLKRNKKELGLTATDVDDVLSYICKTAEHHLLYFSWRPCLSDPGDEMVLEIAIAAGARYIVTHNTRHFKKLHGYTTRAITPAEFLKLLEV